MNWRESTQPEPAKGMTLPELAAWAAAQPQAGEPKGVMPSATCVGKVTKEELKNITPQTALAKIYALAEFALIEGMPVTPEEVLKEILFLAKGGLHHKPDPAVTTEQFFSVRRRDPDGLDWVPLQNAEACARQVWQDARERCAQIVDAEAKSCYPNPASAILRGVADAIRKEGRKPS